VFYSSLFLNDNVFFLGIFLEQQTTIQNRCGQNHAWRQFEGHRCTMEIVDKDEPPYEFDKKCDDAGVRDGYTFPIFR